MYLGTQEIFMAEKSDINIGTIKMPTLRYCTYGTSPAKSGKGKSANEAASKQLVDKIFKIFGAGNSDEITREQIIEVDKKNNPFAVHGRQMRQPTLSKSDIESAFWGKDAEQIMSRDASVKKHEQEQAISQWDFAALLGGCFSDAGNGTRILITRDRATSFLENNKEARVALESFFEIK